MTDYRSVLTQLIEKYDYFAEKPLATDYWHEQAAAIRAALAVVTAAEQVMGHVMPVTVEDVAREDALRAALSSFRGEPGPGETP